MVCGRHADKPFNLYNYTYISFKLLEPTSPTTRLRSSGSTHYMHPYNIYIRTSLSDIFAFILDKERKIKFCIPEESLLMDTSLTTLLPTVGFADFIVLFFFKEFLSIGHRPCETNLGLMGLLLSTLSAYQ